MCDSNNSELCYLNNIKLKILTEVSTYMNSNFRNFNKNNNTEEAICYKCTDCIVKEEDRFGLAFHNASDMFSAKIYIEEGTSSKNCRQKEHSVVVKVMPKNDVQRAMQNSVDQFSNECKMFSSIIPMLLKMCSTQFIEDRKKGIVYREIPAAIDMFPKCYLSSDDPDFGMIVLEDLREEGYKMSGNKLLLMDYEHIEVALKGLARFHALSYGMKKKDIDMLKNHIQLQLRDARCFFHKSESSKDIFFQLTRNALILIFKEFSKTEAGEKELYKEKIVRILDKFEDLDVFVRELLSPEEPFAVLCHGDYNMNNLMFRYDSENKPIGIKILDFQNLYYASPVIDLSFFIYMNSSSEVRTKHWDEILSVYLSTLLNALSEYSGTPKQELEQQFNLQFLKHQYSKYALYGFIMSASFLVSFLNDPHCMERMDDFKDSNPSDEEIKAIFLKHVRLDTKEVRDRIFSLVLHVLDNTCL